MTDDAVSLLVERARLDLGFRRLLQERPRKALRGRGLRRGEVSRILAVRGESASGSTPQERVLAAAAR